MAVLSAASAPVLLHVETPPAELDRLASRTTRDSHLATPGPKRTWLPSPESVVPLTFAPDATLNFAALTGGSAPDKRSLPPVAGMPLHPTSGTTGIPKLAARHGVAAIAEAAHYQEAMGIGPGDTILCVVPMSHAYGFGTSAMMPLVSGASVVSSRRFQPHAVFQAFRDLDITTFPAVPAMLHLLLVASRGPIARLPRRVLSAGVRWPSTRPGSFSRRTGRRPGHSMAARRRAASASTWRRRPTLRRDRSGRDAPVSVRSARFPTRPSGSRGLATWPLNRPQ